MAAFAFPPLYSFPPFFTRQLHEETWLRQRKLWAELILAYAEAQRLFELDVSAEATLSLALFHNPAIDRRMDRPFLNEIVAFMLEQKTAARAGSGRVLLLWRSPAQWAQLVGQWVASVGGAGSVYTLYELLHGDETRNEAFHGLPEPLCRLVVAELERSGRARLISASPATALLESGLKFT